MSEVSSKRQWSDPYHGVTHYGEPRGTQRWATVTSWETFSELTTWTNGQGFGQPQYTFSGKNHTAEAKKAGWLWTNEGKCPAEGLRSN